VTLARHLCLYSRSGSSSSSCSSSVESSFGFQLLQASSSWPCHSPTFFQPPSSSPPSSSSSLLTGPLPCSLLTFSPSIPQVAALLPPELSDAVCRELLLSESNRRGTSRHRHPFCLLSRAPRLAADPSVHSCLSLPSRSADLPPSRQQLLNEWVLGENFHLLAANSVFLMPVLNIIAKASLLPPSL
jgi:hypothetical protein